VAGCSDACPAAIGDYDTNPVCNAGGTLVKVTGCGKVMFQTVGFGGSAPIFDAASGALRGVTQSSDVASGPCGVHLYVYGEGLAPTGSLGAAPADECPEAQIQRCKVCGPLSLSNAPPCS
jgi:hypothetical protein